MPLTATQEELANPFYIADQAVLTQTSGWLDAWSSAPSAYVVAAATTADVVAAVSFAREHNLRVVIRGGGHSYQGTSNAADSLLIWTRAINEIVLHDAFVPQGCASTHAPLPAVTVGAGALWMEVYQAVTTQAGQYVQGGGCTTVGVAGLIQSGGFGSFSKNYGLAAAGLLEAEVVTADGRVAIANASTNPDLFWALKGGGGGSFGIVTRLTLRTHELPAHAGGVVGTIQAHSAAAFRQLVHHLITFYHQSLFDRHWGEQMRFLPEYRIDIGMLFQDLDQQRAEAIWQPFVRWITARAQEYTWVTPLRISAFPARYLWDVTFLNQHVPELIFPDNRPDAPRSNFAWSGDRNETRQFLHGYHSAWLPAALLQPAQHQALVDALVAGSRHKSIALHFNKGLAGAPPNVQAQALDTAINPAVVDAFALAIIAGNGPPAPVSSDERSEQVTARQDAEAIRHAMAELVKAAPAHGSYGAESDFFASAWQQSFWGLNYPRLLATKQKYDPAGLFVVHHGVGSEYWSADGFTRLA